MPCDAPKRSRSAVRDLGVEIRAGCHTGEIELAGDDVHGIAVHIGARVSASAGASEVLVSSTVKDLVAGSGLVFEDAGEHELKGVPDRWRLYRVVELMGKTPRTRYVKTTDDVYIAYQVVGEGPDLVWQFDYFGNVDAVWEHPLWAHFLGGFAQFSRLILLDRRGTGQSSRNVPPSDLETRASDLRAVLDALGSDIVVAGGHGQGGAASALFAATEPDRVRAFVWEYAPRPGRDGRPTTRGERATSTSNAPVG